MARTDPVIAIHGGAGAMPRAAMTARAESGLHAALAQALQAGADVLLCGGSSLDAVESAVRVLEDCPLFNAGRGAVFTSEETIELDAAVMDGPSRRAGAVACVRGVRNPVSAARAVLEQSPHVLLAGAGALAFARAHGLPIEDESYFRTPERRGALERLRAGARATEQERHGTVGAVALDSSGRLAAATSTGGRTNKLPGRIGDSPIVGAGTYADSIVAVSGTGDGEVFMRCVAAYRVSVLMELGGHSVHGASRAVLATVRREGGRGGLIALDRRGKVAMPFNSEGMYRGMCRGHARPRTGIYRSRLR